MFGDAPFASTPYGSVSIAALDVRGLVWLSAKSLFSVEIASALAPIGKVQLSDYRMFKLIITNAVKP